jgi:RNA polymerase sigma-70 factor (ECF subfamily)
MLSSMDREAAFRRIYDAHYRYVVAYARRRLDEQDAQDVVADTFLVAWRRIEDVPEGPDALPWLYAVARRTVAQAHRSRGRRLRLIGRLTRVPGHGQQLAFEPAEDHIAIHQAMATLRFKDQELLRLAEWEDLGPKQLAVVLGCSPNAASIRLHRAHRRLERALQAIEAGRELPAEREQAG